MNQAQCLRELTAVVTIALLGAWNVTGTENQLHGAAIVPDSVLQVQIARTMAAENEAAFRKELTALRQMGGQHYEKMIPQLLVYSAQGTERSAMALPTIMKQLQPSKEESLNAILPHLGVEDVQLQRLLVHILHSIDGLSRGEKTDFSYYQTVLAKAENQPAANPLVRYMYRRDPEAALLAMSRVYGTGTAESELDAELKKGPPAIVEALSLRPEWWAHLYVAVTMKKNPQLRDPEIRKRLEKDDHPLVREALSGITSAQSDPTDPGR